MVAKRVTAEQVYSTSGVKELELLQNGMAVMLIHQPVKGGKTKLHKFIKKSGQWYKLIQDPPVAKVEG